jgi:SagB-type dehydrogenase family enzyme
MWMRWSEEANACLDGANATIEIHGSTIFLPGGATLILRLRQLLRQPQPLTVLERELSNTAPVVTETFAELLNAQAVAPWDLGPELALLHKKTVSGGESHALSPALESARALRETGYCGPITLLPYADLPEVSLQKILVSRRTSRSFSPEPASLETLGVILDLSARAGGDGVPAPKVPGGPPGNRPYPSGGGLYPVELAIYASAVRTLDRGFYLYQPLGHSLTRAAAEPVQKIGDLMGGHAVDDAAFCVLLFLDFGRVSLSKYGRKAYRLALLEAGHLAQNLLLVATALGLATLPLCGFDDERLSQAAGLQYPQQPVVYVIAVGTPVRGADD